MSAMYFINTIKTGLPVHNFMNTNERTVRAIPFGEGFTAYKTFTKSATQFWAQITNNPPGTQQEFVLVSIGSKKYAELHPGQESIDIAPEFFLEMYQFMVARGYSGASPFWNKE